MPWWIWLGGGLAFVALVSTEKAKPQPQRTPSKAPGAPAPSPELWPVVQRTQDAQGRLRFAAHVVDADGSPYWQARYENGGLRMFLTLADALAAARAALADLGQPVSVPAFWWHDTRKFKDWERIAGT